MSSYYPSYNNKIPPTYSMGTVFRQSNVWSNNPNFPSQVGAGSTLNSVQLSRNYTKSSRYEGDLDDYQFDLQCQRFLNDLYLSPPMIDWLQSETVGQSTNHLWWNERRMRLTASNFGRVFCMRDTTFRAHVVAKMLSPNGGFSNVAMEQGASNERKAIDAYAKQKKQIVEPCGLFVHPQFGYLGASPDGLIGDDGLLEVKCPSSANQGYLQKVYCEDDRVRWRLRTNHDYFYQIQGQLEVTGRNFCDFVVWTPQRIQHIERIFRDRNVWLEMFPKLERFYKLSLLPELVNPRIPRDLPVKEPDFVLRARGM